MHVLKWTDAAQPSERRLYPDTRRTGVDFGPSIREASGRCKKAAGEICPNLALPMAENIQGIVFKNGHPSGRRGVCGVCAPDRLEIVNFLREIDVFHFGGVLLPPTCADYTCVIFSEVQTWW